MYKSWFLGRLQAPLYRKHQSLDTVHALRDALTEFDGAVVLISHDRFLLRSLVEESEEDDSDEDNGDVAKSISRKSLYALRLKKLEMLDNGISDYEKHISKSIKAVE
jgi:ATPase subunit of ABC transporter with duplicated ATPase domains